MCVVECSTRFICSEKAFVFDFGESKGKRKNFLIDSNFEFWKGDNINLIHKHLCYSIHISSIEIWMFGHTQTAFVPLLYFTR